MLPVDGTTRVVGLEEETGGKLWWGTGPPGGGRGCRTTGVDARVHIMLVSKNNLWNSYKINAKGEHFL